MIRKFENLPFLKFKTNSREEMYSKRPHSHNEVSIGFIESGTTTITVQNQKYLLSPEDLVLIPSRTVHICIPADISRFKFRMFYIDEEWWSRNLPIAPDSFKTLAFPITASFRKFIFSTGTDISDDKKLEERLSASLKEIIGRYNPDSIGSHSLEQEQELEKIHRLIREMPQASLPLEELAQQAGFNKFNLIRRYSGRYGLTPHADIINMRIQRAVLLLETDMELVDIALNCGFSDQSHFINQFKLYCGLRPLEYRKGIREI